MGSPGGQMKKQIKRVVDIFMKFMSFPLYMSFICLKPIVGKRKAFSSVMQAAAILPGTSGEWYRRGILQWTTQNRLTDCCISFGCLFSDPDLKISRGVYLGTACNIGKTDINENCIIGSNVHITSGLRQHRFDSIDSAIRDQGGRFDRVVIGKNSWIGNGAIISADIGSNCVIGVGSVVVKPIPDYAVAVGNPAKVIQSRKKDT